MNMRTISYTFALVLACGPDKGDGDGSSSTGETQTASTGASEPTGSTTDPTSPTSVTGTGEATTGEGTTASSISISTSETDATGTTAGTGDTGTTDELPPGACRSDADCFAENFEICFAPDEFNCGACQVPETPCMPDDTCAPGLVCVPFMAPCACDPGEGACVPVCDADSCGREASCNAMTGACEPLKCSGDGPACPPLFACVPVRGGEDECQRQACETDEDCGGQPCVEGLCHEGFGVCQPPAP
jgi:hypothetical protein